MILLMLVKRAVYYVLAAGPFLLIGLIAINSRMNTNHWEFVEYGRETTTRIHAYARPVTLVRQTVVKGKATSPEALRQTIDAWLESSRKGELKDIVPPTTYSEGTTPIYDQVVRAKQTLVDTALRHGHVLQSQGKARDAAYFYADVLELADIAKYSEFSSLTESATYQVSTLRRIAQLAPQLDADVRAGILERIDALDPGTERSLIHIVDRLSVAYSHDVQRDGRSAALIEAARDSRRLASNEDPLIARINGWEKLSNGDPALVSLSGRSRVAYSQHVRYQAQLAETRAALELGPEPSLD